MLYLCTCMNTLRCVCVSSPCCERRRCVRCPSSQCVWPGSGRWLDDGWRPWSERQRSHEVWLKEEQRDVCVCVWELMTSHFTHYTAVVVFMKVIVLRSERRCLFFSFLLLLRPALDGDSSFGLFWLDNLDEPCELKWVGTWRASPPCEANVALHPPTTHCSNREEMIWFHIARTGASNNDLVQRFPIRSVRHFVPGRSRTQWKNFSFTNLLHSLRIQSYGFPF